MRPEDAGHLADALASLAEPLSRALQPIIAANVEVATSLGREATRNLEAATDQIVAALADLEKARYSRGEIHARNRLIRAAGKLRDMRREQLKRRRTP